MQTISEMRWAMHCNIDIDSIHRDVRIQRSNKASLISPPDGSCAMGHGGRGHSIHIWPVNNKLHNGAHTTKMICMETIHYPRQDFFEWHHFFVLGADQTYCFE
jgi:hypothetical protein